MYLRICWQLVNARNQGSAEAVAGQAYNNLQLLATGPVNVSEVHNTTLLIDDNGFLEALSIDFAMLATAVSLTAHSSLDTKQSTNPSNSLWQFDNSAYGDTGYVADHIVDI